MKQLTYIAPVLLSLVACSSDSVNSNEQARRAYLGLDLSIQKSMQLGFDGFNTASSANIMQQTAMGSASGTLAINGQVDQGSSANKGMRLVVGMTNYSDGPVVIDNNNDTVSITYATDTATATQPALTLNLKNIPTGTLDGTLVGTYHLTGDIKGDIDVNLTFAGSLMAGSGSNMVERAPGTTSVTGTVMSSGGTYDVSVSI